MSDDIKIAARNRRARHDYAILETLEAGLVLLGTEVKSIRQGRASIAEAYGAFSDEELFLRDMHVPEYANRGYSSHEPKRPRKLLLHRRELRKLRGKVQERGFTLIPLLLYFKEGRAKIELAVVRGKQHHDKRQSIKSKEARRDIERARSRKKS